MTARHNLASFVKILCCRFELPCITYHIPVKCRSDRCLAMKNNVIRFRRTVENYRIAFSTSLIFFCRRLVIAVTLGVQSACAKPDFHN